MPTSGKGNRRGFYREPCIPDIPYLLRETGPKGKANSTSPQRSTTLTMEKWSAQSIIAVKHAAERTILGNHVVYSEILWQIIPVPSGNSHK